MLNNLKSKKKKKAEEEHGLKLQITVLREMQDHEESEDETPKREKRAKIGKE